MSDTAGDMQAIIEGIMRVEEFNDQFRQPNPNERYPVCKPEVGGNLCVRCRFPVNIEFRGQRPPCPAVPPDGRWGEDWSES